MGGLVADLNAKLDEQQKTRQELTQAVDAAATKKDNASKTSDGCNEDLQKAQADKKAAEGALKAAESACRTFYPDMKRLMDGLDKEKAALEEFKSTVQVAFKELESLAAPPPPEQSPEASEEAEVEAAAEEAGRNIMEL